MFERRQIALVLGASLALANAQAMQLDGNQLVLESPVQFAPDSAAVSERDPGLLEVKAYLDAKSYITRLRIEAHVASPVAGGLSARRALAVSQTLVQMGVDCHRLLPVDFGDTKPVSLDPAQNTRITFVNAELRQRAIGGLPLDGGGRPLEWPCEN